jgi:hypothetical protein
VGPSSPPPSDLIVPAFRRGLDVPVADFSNPLGCSALIPTAVEPPESELALSHPMNGRNEIRHVAKNDAVRNFKNIKACDLILIPIHP